MDTGISIFSCKEREQGVVTLLSAKKKASLSSIVSTVSGQCAEELIIGGKHDYQKHKKEK